METQPREQLPLIDVAKRHVAQQKVKTNRADEVLWKIRKSQPYNHTTEKQKLFFQDLPKKAKRLILEFANTEDLLEALVDTNKVEDKIFTRLKTLIANYNTARFQDQYRGPTFNYKSDNPLFDNTAFFNRETNDFYNQLRNEHNKINWYYFNGTGISKYINLRLRLLNRTADCTNALIWAEQIKKDLYDHVIKAPIELQDTNDLQILITPEQHTHDIFIVM